MLLPQLLLPSVELPGPLASLLIPSLEGIDNARCLAIASFVIIFYDYFITLDDEVSLTFKWIRLYVFPRLMVNRSNTSGLGSGLFHGYYILSSVFPVSGHSLSVDHWAACRIDIYHNASLCMCVITIYLGPSADIATPELLWYVSLEAGLSITAPHCSYSLTVAGFVASDLSKEVSVAILQTLSHSNNHTIPSCKTYFRSAGHINIADTDDSCDRAIRACFTLSVLAMLAVQGKRLSPAHSESADANLTDTTPQPFLSCEYGTSLRTAGQPERL